MTSLSSPSSPKPQEAEGAHLSSQVIDDLVRELSRLPAGATREAARDRVVRQLLPMARRISARFRKVGGEEQDDLFQVACLGLVKAVDGYDPQLGHAFLSYALPTVTGEIKRHLRDRAGLVRLPRPVQEARLQVARTRRELEQRSGGRTPTHEEIAGHCCLPVEVVAEVSRSERVSRPRSLDTADEGPDGARPSFAEITGRPDSALELADERVELIDALRQFPDRERRILYLRFFQDQTQQQIAEALGISQMHVSRLLSRCLTRLRDLLAAPESGAAPTALERTSEASTAAPDVSAPNAEPAPAAWPDVDCPAHACRPIRPTGLSRRTGRQSALPCRPPVARRRTENPRYGNLRYGPGQRVREAPTSVARPRLATARSVNSRTCGADALCRRMSRGRQTPYAVRAPDQAGCGRLAHTTRAEIAATAKVTSGTGTAMASPHGACRPAPRPPPCGRRPAFSRPHRAGTLACR
ncbi:sigma-70 family RNA polymerase sigma factor [Streptomyces hundungensis]|uniref:sigma-70 family RNA polymerase sigma factor n=1 Tax=Streptomyces hundungensis TaxID=1077946 RepID=UPI0033DA6076